MGEEVKWSDAEKTNNDVILETDHNLEIKHWLNDDVKLPQYYTQFAENDFNCLQLIQEIQDEKTLEKIGIVSIGHQVKIMSAIRKMQQKTEGKDEEGVNPTVEGVAITGNNDKNEQANDEFVVNGDDDE